MKQWIIALALLAGITASARERIPVFIVAGQSNTDGRVPNRQLPAYVRANGYRHAYWCYNNGWYSSQGRFERFWPRIYNSDDSCKWAYDAITYYYLDKSMGRDFYVIKESRGGTAISLRCPSDHGMYWSASPDYLRSTQATDQGGKSLLKALCENIDRCIDQSLAKKGKLDIKALIWHQGESDRRDDSLYYENLKAVVAYVRQHVADKTGDKKYLKLPVIVGGIAHASHGYSKGVEDGQRRLQQEDPNFHLVEVPDATLQSDCMHFDAKGAEMLGVKVYNKLVDLKLAGKHASRVAE